MADKQGLIKSVYYNAEIGFTGQAKLYKTLKQMYPEAKITQSDIKAFLGNQAVAQTMQKGKQGSFVATHAKQEFQVDLIYIKNTGLNFAKYGLVCIDIFTKFTHIILMKKRDTANTVDTMRQILKLMGVPEMIYCDEGSEFTSTGFKELMAEKQIELVFSANHAPVVERVNRTIKEMIDKYLKSTNSKTITNILPKILKNYNNSFHKTIRITPTEATDNTNKEQVKANIQGAAKPEVKRPDIKIGDHVRYVIKIVANKVSYAKPKYSEEIFTVTAIDDQGRYTIDRTGKGLKTFVRAHLLKVDKGKVEHNNNEADLDGTLEGRLKKGLKKKVVHKLPAQSAAEERSARPSRIRKQVDHGAFIK